MMANRSFEKIDMEQETKNDEPGVLSCKSTTFKLLILSYHLKLGLSLFFFICALRESWSSVGSPLRLEFLCIVSALIWHQACVVNASSLPRWYRLADDNARWQFSLKRLNLLVYSLAFLLFAFISSLWFSMDNDYNFIYIEYRYHQFQLFALVTMINTTTFAFFIYEHLPETPRQRHVYCNTMFRNIGIAFHLFIFIGFAIHVATLYYFAVAYYSDDFWSARLVGVYGWLLLSMFLFLFKVRDRFNRTTLCDLADTSYQCLFSLDSWAFLVAQFALMVGGLLNSLWSSDEQLSADTTFSTAIFALQLLSIPILVNTAFLVLAVYKARWPYT